MYQTCDANDFLDGVVAILGHVIERPEADDPDPSADRDAADIGRAAAGDVDAFGRLYQVHAPRIHMLARHVLGTGDADDATQDIFVRAWERLGQYRGESSLGTWLHRLAMNVLLRRAEAQRRDQRTDTIDDDAHEASGASPDAAIDLETALAQLDPDLRRVVVLHDVEGYAHDEIASILGITAGGSRMRLHRARTALRVRVLR